MRSVTVLPAAAALALVAVPLRAQEAPPTPPASVPVMVLPAIGGADQLLPLLRRSDVQNAIRLTVVERNSLTDLLDGGKMPVRVQVTMKDGGDPASAQRQAQEQIATQMKGIDDRIRAALKPEQYDRLVEISLQWKGPMTLSESRTAERLKISPAHRAEIVRITSDYQVEKSKILISLSQQRTQTSPDGSKQMVMMRVNTQALDDPTTPAYKKLSALKKDADEKILALLTPEERGSWNAAQGAPMTFLKGIPGNRF